MCGLAGIVRFDDKPIQRGRLEAMLRHLRHRGPDGEGIWTDDRAGLVHARLSVIDLLSGQQPMHLPQRGEHGDLHLVFNGEIYNHRELRKKLEQRGHSFQSDHSDTEVLLLGYREWGDELPKHLHGMFAFAIWDASVRTLLLCRDRTGKKPLYFRKRGNDLSFASLVATLVAGYEDGDSPNVNPAAMLNYLRLGYTFSDSMIEGVEELPPAHAMLINSRGEWHIRRYWRPPPISRTSTSLGAVDSLREVLEEAVASRLEADVPLGCFLSGGIDSSVVAAIAQKQLLARGAQSLRTYSVAMPEADYDESPYAAEVARHIGANHSVLQTEPGDAISDLQHLMAIIGEPTADSSLLPTYWLCKATRQHVEVALSGDGGDELFGGYDRYRALRLLHWHRWWLRQLPTGLLGSTRARSSRTRLRRLVEAARAGSSPATQYHQMIHLFTDAQIREFAMRDVSDQASYGSPPAPDWLLHVDPVHAAMRWDLTHYLPYELLRKVDRASMAVALEVRCPLLDTQVCDLAGHLPPRVLMPKGQPKGLLRTLAAEYLPASIIKRPKRGFAIPVGTWLRTNLRDALSDQLFDGTLEGMGVARLPMERYFNEHVQQRVDHTHRLFALLQLSLWGKWLREQTRQ